MGELKRSVPNSDICFEFLYVFIIVIIFLFVFVFFSGKPILHCNIFVGFFF